MSVFYGEPIQTKVFKASFLDIDAIAWKPGALSCVITHKSAGRTSTTVEVSLAELIETYVSFERMLRVANIRATEKKPEYQAKHLADGVKRIIKRLSKYLVQDRHFFMDSDSIKPWGDMQKLTEFKLSMPAGEMSHPVSWDATWKQGGTNLDRSVEDRISQRVLEANCPGLDALLRSSSLGSDNDSAQTFKLVGELFGMFAFDVVAANAVSFVKQLHVYRGMKLAREQEIALLLASVGAPSGDSGALDLPPLDQVGFSA
jgi:hypothetical protein